MSSDTDTASRDAKLYKRGMVTNGCGVIILGVVSYFLGLQTYVLIALGLQYAVFLFHGLPMRSEKFYDLSGSFTHLALVFTSLVSERRERSPRQLFAAVAAVLWMTRLGTYLYSRILKDGKDERFDRLKPVWLSFMGAWTLQAVWVTLIEMPVVLLNSHDDLAATTNLDLAAMACWVIGYIVEATADTQKQAFRNIPSNRSKYITTGLWRYSRHPNYFGEILMWSSLAVLASMAGLHAAWLSPLFTVLLLTKVSGVPMVEKAGLEKWGNDPAYMHYMEKTSCIVPWLPAPRGN